MGSVQTLLKFSEDGMMGPGIDVAASLMHTRAFP